MQVPSLATMAALGHEVIAVDLPGYGRTKELFTTCCIHAGSKPGNYGSSGTRGESRGPARIRQN